MRGKPKHFTLRFNIEHRATFESIRSGKKRVETRAATPRYQGIKAGDRITFVCGPSRFSKTVKKTGRFRSFAAIFKAYGPNEISPGIGTKRNMIARWRSFPGYSEKLKQYGLMAYELS